MIKVCLFQSFISIAGFAMLWIYGNWRLALGTFLMIWGNNLGQAILRKPECLRL